MTTALKPGSILLNGKDITKDCSLSEESMPAGWAAIMHRKLRVATLYEGKVEIAADMLHLGYTTPSAPVDPPA